MDYPLVIPANCGTEFKTVARTSKANEVSRLWQLRLFTAVVGLARAHPGPSAGPSCCGLQIGYLLWLQQHFSFICSLLVN